MKRLICTLAAFAMLSCTGPPAQAGYQGTLRGDMGWFLIVNNNGIVGKTSVTVYFLGTKAFQPVLITVPAVAAPQYPFPKPERGVRRIIIEVHPPVGANPVPVEVTQLASFPATCVGDTALVFDVE